MNNSRRALFTLCGVALTLLAGLIFATLGSAPHAVLAQAESGITAPASGSTVTGVVTVTGTATDPNFQRYELYFKPDEAGDDAFAYISENVQAVNAGTLGVWDTTDLPPGAYALRMRVVRNDGNYAEYFVENVQVGLDEPTPTATTEPTAVVTDTTVATATATLTPTSAPEVEEPAEEPAAETTDQAQVVTESNINVRGGPSTDYPIVGTLQSGDSALITGQNAAGDWWQIQIDGDSGWVLGQLVTAENATAVPVVDAPPAPPTPTAEPETVAEATAAEEAATDEATEETDEATAAEEAPVEDATVVDETSAEVAAAAPLAVSGSVSLTLTGNDADPAALREFLRAVLVAFTPDNTVITATVGALPSNLPIELTLPPTATVVGGVVRTGEFGGGQIFLSTTESAEDLVALVRTQLLEQGYTVPAQGQMLGSSGQVFLSSNEFATSLFLCSPDDAIGINLGAATMADGTEAVMLSINPTSRFGGPCAEDPAGGDAGMFDLLPQLAPPSGAIVQSSGGGTSSGPDSISLSASAEIQSELTPADLAAHYEEQLAATGWEQLGTSQTDELTWSAWSFTDDEDVPWTATFYIVRQAGADDSYMATLHAESQP